MASPHQSPIRRSAVACNRCRSRKTKCAGSPPEPCVACRGAGQTCVYSQSDKKVTISESELLELQAKAQAASPQRSDTRPEPEDISTIEGEWQPTETNNWMKNASGQYHYIGSSSSNYIANRLNPTAGTLDWHAHPHYSDLSWLRRVDHPELPPLPPYELAKRLYRAQHAYIGTIFSFIRDGDFYQRLDHLYSHPPNPSGREDGLVICQLLLVFALGQMYSVNQWISDDGPPGFIYFKHALKFLPGAHEDGSILFVEVLGYLAYYLQTLNRRDSAYIYIGIATRMAISLGLHQEVLGQDLPLEEREHRRRVWWSTYSMERLLSLSLGHPACIQDDDIDLQLPSQIGTEDPRVSMIIRSYTQLARIQGIIGEDIYRKKQRSRAGLLSSVQRIMQRLSDWFSKLPDDLKIGDNVASSGVFRELVSTHLHYYHCINITARPLLLYVVQRHVAANAQRPRVSRWEDGHEVEFVTIVDNAIAAARSSIALLKMAAEYNLVATYGFIDGEQAFSAALLLAMVNLAFPYKDKDASAMDNALTVLQGMAERGNRYMQACHALLTRIKHTAKPNAGTSSTSPGYTASTPGIPEGSVNLETCDDPALWAEVLDSIEVDMDRQWIESTLLREPEG